MKSEHLLPHKTTSKVHFELTTCLADPMRSLWSLNFKSCFDNVLSYLDGLGFNVSLPHRLTEYDA